MLKNFEVRDYREKNWYWQDNEYLNGYAKLCGVSATAVYLSLCRHADKKQSCFPSIKLIAEEHNINERTVSRAIKVLEKYNIVKKEKTRTKNGKWLNNSYILLNKKEWDKQPTPLESPMDSHRTITTQPQDNNDTATPLESPTNKTNHNKTNKKKTHIFAGKPAVNEINLLLKEFEVINPTINYGNKTQRKVLEDMLKKFGYEKLLNTIKYAVSVQSKQYAPTITTPYQLKEKMGALLIYYKREHQPKKGMITSL